MVVLRNQLRRHRRLVDVQCEAARLFRLGRVALVVEERDDVIGVPPERRAARQSAPRRPG